MGLGDRVASRLRSTARSIAFLTVSDHPENGGVTGDLDPDDWPDESADDAGRQPDSPEVAGGRPHDGPGDRPADDRDGSRSG